MFQVRFVGLVLDSASRHPVFEVVFHKSPAAMPLAVALSIFLFAGAGSAAAQMGMAGHDMGAHMKEVPAPEKLPVPLKMTGIGNSHIAITANPEAQMWFDQGLDLLHDFWDYESEKAFEQAVRTDPKCAMCYWGYQALNFRHSLGTGYSHQELAAAVRLKGNAGKAERLYIEAAVAEEEAVKAAGPEGQPDDEKGTAILRRLVKKYPADPQAKIFLAASLRDGYDEAGEPKQGTKESIAILEQVLKTNPNDSAANHYWIHAVEASARPQQALRSATVLAGLAPASGHMVHMPGHIFYRVGDYAQAEHWFAASTAVDERYLREQHVDVDDDWNYVHNLMYGVENLMEEGKLREAATLSAKLPGARGQLSETLYTGSPRDGIARLHEQLPVALRTGDWANVLKMLQASGPEARLPNLALLAGQLKEFANGMQAVQAGDLSAAETASLKLDAELWRMSQNAKDTPKKKDAATTTTPLMAEVMPDAKIPPLLSNLSIMSLELRAAILAGQKRLPEAKALFEQAAREEKDLGYNEPPRYIRPVGESEGIALLRAGDYAAAHQAYAAALAQRPKSGFALYGMARSSEAAGDAALAQKEYVEFMDAWKNADPGLPEVAHSRDYMTAHSAIAVRR